MYTIHCIIYVFFINRSRSITLSLDVRLHHCVFLDKIKNLPLGALRVKSFYIAYLFYYTYTALPRQKLTLISSLFYMLTQYINSTNTLKRNKQRTLVYEFDF